MTDYLHRSSNHDHLLAPTRSHLRCAGDISSRHRRPRDPPHAGIVEEVLQFRSLDPEDLRGRPKQPPFFF